MIHKKFLTIISLLAGLALSSCHVDWNDCWTRDQLSTTSVAGTFAASGQYTVNANGNYLGYSSVNLALDVQNGTNLVNPGDINIKANTGGGLWLNTGIFVNPDDKITITAKGDVWLSNPNFSLDKGIPISITAGSVAGRGPEIQMANLPATFKNGDYLQINLAPAVDSNVNGWSYNVNNRVGTHTVGAYTAQKSCSEIKPNFDMAATNYAQNMGNVYGAGCWSTAGSNVFNLKAYVGFQTSTNPASIYLLTTDGDTYTAFSSRGNQFQCNSAMPSWRESYVTDCGSYGIACTKYNYYTPQYIACQDLGATGNYISYVDFAGVSHTPPNKAIKVNYPTNRTPAPGVSDPLDLVFMFPSTNTTNVGGFNFLVKPFSCVPYSTVPWEDYTYKLLTGPNAALPAKEIGFYIQGTDLVCQVSGQQPAIIPPPVSVSNSEISETLYTNIFQALTSKSTYVFTDADQSAIYQFTTNNKLTMSPGKVEVGGYLPENLICEYKGNVVTCGPNTRMDTICVYDIERTLQQQITNFNGWARDGYPQQATNPSSSQPYGSYGNLQAAIIDEIVNPNHSLSLIPAGQIINRPTVTYKSGTDPYTTPSITSIDSVVANKSGVLWLRVNNIIYDYPQATGAYNVFVSVTPPGTFSFTDVTNTLRNVTLDATINLYQGITCSNTGTVTENCMHFIKLIRVMLTLYVIFYAIGFIIGIVEISAYDVMIRILKIAIVISLTSDGSWKFFNDNFFALFYGSNGTASGGVIDFLIASISNTSATSEAASSFALFTNFFGMFLYNFDIFFIRMLAILASSPIGIILFVVLVAATWAYFAEFLRYLLIFVTSYLGLTVLIGLAPLFIPCILFSQTRQYFDRWIKFLVRFVFEPVILFIGLMIFSNLIKEALFNVLSFSVCFECAIYMDIPQLFNIIPFIGPMLNKVLFAHMLLPRFCIPFFVPWGHDPGIFNMFDPTPNVYPTEHIINRADKLDPNAKTIETIKTNYDAAPISGYVVEINRAVQVFTYAIFIKIFKEYRKMATSIVNAMSQVDANIPANQYQREHSTNLSDKAIDTATNALASTVGLDDHSKYVRRQTGEHRETEARDEANK